MDDLEYELLNRLEAGHSVFRPAVDRGDAQELFAKTVALLTRARDQGWIRFPDGRIARTEAGLYLAIGPCDLTDSGRAALARDRRLGERPRLDPSRIPWRLDR